MSTFSMFLNDIFLFPLFKHFVFISTSLDTLNLISIISLHIGLISNYRTFFGIFHKNFAVSLRIKIKVNLAFQNHLNCIQQTLGSFVLYLLLKTIHTPFTFHIITYKNGLHTRLHQSIFTFEVATWPMWKRSRSMNIFARHCMYTYTHKYRNTFLSNFNFSPDVVWLLKSYARFYITAV